MSQAIAPQAAWNAWMQKIASARQDFLGQRELIARLFHGQMLGGECLWLRAARGGNREAAQIDPEVTEYVADCLQPIAPGLPNPVVPRQLAIQAALGGNLQDCATPPNQSKPPTLEATLERAALHYADCWNYDWWFAPQQPSDLRFHDPAIVNYLRRLDSLRGLVGALDRVAGRLAGGWFHPGLLCVAETIAAIWIPERLKADYSVSTHVLLAPTAVHQPGLVARLTLERLPDGCGAIYPDPRTSGYLLTDKRFQVAVQNAWWLEVGSSLGPKESAPRFDVRWSLAIVSHEGHPLLTQVQDRSGEVAFVVGLRALRRREGLDDNVAVTAQLEGPLTTTASNGAVQVVFDATSRLSPGLLPVGGVAQKALAREMAPEMYQRRITRVIVAPGQAEAGESWDNGRLTFPVAVSLDGVYHHMARWARLTLTANRYLAAQAKRRLDTECDPYLRSTLSRRKQAEQSATRDVPDKDPYEQLDSRIVDQIVLGTCTRATLAASSEGEAAGGALRLALYADSGVGKSMFLVHCEHEIADRYSQPRVDGSNDPLRLPVRLTHLSGYSWHEPTKFWSEELPLLFMEPLREVLEEGADTIGEIRSWLEHLRGRAQLVFLLDALDQTKSVPDLHDWIDLKGGVSRCPVYITGRQFAIEHTRSAALPDRCMLLRLDKFHREQQEKFLGPDLARELLPQQRDDKGVRARKERWQDLLDVPLLLKYVRDLARDGTLPTLPNRERVYTQAIDRLIAKGLESHKATNEPPVKPEHARRWFAAAAWSMVEAENFTGVVSDRQYHRLMEDLKSRVGVPHEDILDRINVGRQELRSLAHGTATAFEWRHLSFCEYFAGTYLAEEREPEHVEQELSRILDMVAAVRRAQEARLSRNSDDTGDGVLLSPRDRWYWVFRFALSRAFARASTGDLGEREAFRNRTLLLARTLIASGHPHVVWDAIRADGVRLPNEWDQLCRWLVHQTWSWNVRDDREAWQSDQPPAILASTLHAIVTHLDRRYRNGSTLAAAWTLVEQALASRDEEVKAQASDIARSFLSPEATVDSADRESLRQLRESFRPCPGLNFDRGKARNMWRADDGKAWVFEMGASNLDGDAGPDEFPRHKMRIAPFEIMEFSVTNAAFEVLDPSHYFLRDRYSADDDQPATWVSWYTADLFARVWLPAQVIPSSSDSQPEPCWEYGLPTECEREFAARGGTGTVFWWGDKFGPEHCNALKIVITSRTFRVTGDALSVTGRVQWRTGRTLSLAETNKSGGYRNPFGLFHMGGNVFEWCADWYDANSYQARCKRLLGVSILRADAVALSGRLRVVRGGSFDRDRSRCRSSDRDSLDPIGCARNVGFRVCRRFGTPESSPDYVL